MTSIKLAIIGGGIVLIALGMVLVTMGDKLTSVDFSAKDLSFSARGADGMGSSSSSVTSTVEPIVDEKLLNSYNSAQLASINQQLSNQEYETEKLNEENKKLQEKITRLENSAPLTRQTTIPNVVGSWNLVGSSMGNFMSGEMIFYQNEEFSFNGMVGDMPIVFAGAYQFDWNQGLLVLFDYQTGIYFSYYLTNIQINSFDMSNPLSYELLTATRN